MQAKRTVSVIMYFIPAAIMVICNLIAVEAMGFSAVHPVAWVITVLLGASALLMYQNRWWGCLLGVAVGFVFVYMGTRETGQIINESPIGVLVCGYYLICGIICYKMREKK